MRTTLSLLSLLSLSACYAHPGAYYAPPDNGLAWIQQQEMMHNQRVMLQNQYNAQAAAHRAWSNDMARGIIKPYSY